VCTLPVAYAAADVDAAWSCPVNDASSLLVANYYFVAMSTLASAQTKSKS
jgi:hypothetical protein